MPELDHEPFVCYLGTRAGLRVAHVADGEREVTAECLPDEAIRAIAIHPSDPADAYVGCGLPGRGLYRTTDGGNTVERLGFEDRWVWGVIRHPNDPETVYVGTEPPMVFVSTDDGVTFTALDGLEEVPSRSTWTFFHDPFRAGHVHGFAIHPDRPERFFAGVEHGALVYSANGGDTWHDELVNHDLHRIAIDPADPDHVVAATGSGLSHSHDAGRSWDSTTDLQGTYLHSIVFDPTSPHRLYAYADRDGDPIVRSDDGGHSWTSIGDGLPAAMPADPLRLHPNDPETLVYAGDTGDRTSHLFVSTDAGETWTRVAGALPKIWRVEVAPVDGEQ